MLYGLWSPLRQIYDWWYWFIKIKLTWLGLTYRFYSTTLAFEFKVKLPSHHSLFAFGLLVWLKCFSAKQKHAVTRSHTSSLISHIIPSKKQCSSVQCVSEATLKQSYQYCFLKSIPQRTEESKYNSDKKHKHDSPCPSFHLPLLPHTDRKRWPHQIVEVIGYPLKHLNTTWRSNTQKHTQLWLYHPVTCVCSYLNHAGWGPWVQGWGYERRRGEDMREEE